MKPVQFYSRDFSDSKISAVKQTYVCQNISHSFLEFAGAMHATLTFDKDAEYVKEEYADLFIHNHDADCKKYTRFVSQKNARISDTAVNIIHALENIDSKNLDDSIIGLAYAAHRDRVAITEPMSASIASRRLYDAIYAKWDVLHSLQFVSHSDVQCRFFESCQCATISHRPENVNGIRLLLFYGNSFSHFSNACFAVDMLNVSAISNKGVHTYYQPAQWYETGNILDIYGVQRLTCSVWEITNQNTFMSLPITVELPEELKKKDTQKSVPIWGIAVSLSISALLLCIAIKPWLSKANICNRMRTHCAELMHNLRQACTRRTNRTTRVNNENDVTKNGVYVIETTQL